MCSYQFLVVAGAELMTRSQLREWLRMQRRSNAAMWEVVHGPPQTWRELRWWRPRGLARRLGRMLRHVDWALCLMLVGLVLFIIGQVARLLQ